MALRQLLQSMSRMSLHNSSCVNSCAILSTSNNTLPVFSNQRCFAHNLPLPWTSNDYLQSVTNDIKGRRNEIRVRIRDQMEYTVKPVPRSKTGGRDERGRVIKRTDSGGAKRLYRMIALNRTPADMQREMIEKVDKIMYDPNRSARIALVANSENKRYIIATQNMKSGDLLKVSKDIPRIAVRPNEGDCYPLGALPIGTLVSSIERVAGEGAKVAKSAGTMGLLVRKIGDRCIVQMPSKREMNVDENCMATVGRVSNIDHNKRVIGKAGGNRWRGIRPRSGLWHRKDGTAGRKINPIKKAKIYHRDDTVKGERQRFEL